MKRLRLVPLLCQLLVLLCCGALQAQSASGEKDLPLDALLNTQISTAAKYEQRVTDVPASVAIITAEEIARNGWHTLAEALVTLPGVTLTYDRGYTYLGVRGVGLPTDFNNRILILLNGQPMLDGVAGTIDTGTALAIALSSLARIEFVRGPGSVLYGSGAMFGVVNLILKSEGDESASIMAGVGSHHTAISSGRFSHRLGSGFSMSLSGSVQNDGGQNLYFPEFDTPSNNNGVTVGHDYDNYRSLVATIAGHGLQLLALTSTRTKGIPTAWFGTTFNEKQQFTDGRSLIALTAQHRASRNGQWFLRASYDRFDYHGVFPYPGDISTDRSSSTRLNGELRYVWDIRPNHRLTLGAERVDNLRANYQYSVGGVFHSIGQPFALSSVYAQSEFQPLHSLSVTAGLRYDKYAGVMDAVNPRGAIVWHANGSNTFKALYGSAFRLPTAFELGFEDPTRDFVPSANLEAEKIRHLELVWEGRLSPEILMTVASYKLHMTGLIKQQTDAVTGETQFRNLNAVISKGIEAQIDYRRGNGLWSYASYSAQNAEDAGVRMVNSPSTLIKAGISSPASRPIQAAIELSHESGRKTYAGADTGGVMLTNVNLSAALFKSVRLSITLKNVTNVKYATPGGIAHPEDTITQNGRTFLVRLRLGG
jgi:outer membrane receptor protein involved in Fe transport